MISEGSAFLDRNGRVIAADEQFRGLLELSGGDPTTELQARAESDPALRAFLGGDGPDAIRLASAEGTPHVELARSRCPEGAFLRAQAVGGLGGPVLEHAMQSVALARLAGGIAHEVKNPLNAMALQIALLTDKVGSAGEPLASACANNLASLRNQIGRVNEVVRRFVDVSDPSPGTAVDVGALAADVASLFGHEARRRRVALACEATPGAVHARADSGRVARILLGLVWRGLSRAGEGTRILVRAAHEGDQACVVVVHGAPADAALEWIPEVAAATAHDLGGRLVRTRSADAERLELRLRRESAP